MLKELQMTLATATLVSGIALAEVDTPHQIEKYGDVADGNPDLIDDREGLKPDPAPGGTEAAGVEADAMETDKVQVYPDTVSDGNPDLGPPDLGSKGSETNQSSSGEAASVYPDSVTEGNTDISQQ